MKFRQKKNDHVEGRIHYDGVVKLDYVDTDLRVDLPGGGHVLIQQRTENNTIDVIFSGDQRIYLHSGDDLEPARRVLKNTGGNVVFMAKQLVVMDLIEDPGPEPKDDE